MARPNPFQSVRQQQTESFFPPSGVDSPFMIEIRRMQEEIRKRIQEPGQTTTPPSGVRPTLPDRPLGRTSEAQSGTKLAQADTGVTSDASSARQTFFEGMVQRGMPPIAAAGFTGGVEQESRFDPLATGDKDPKTGEPRSFGVLQLQGPRRDAFFEFAKAANKDPNNIETQADFAMEEFRTTEKSAARALFGATTVEEAALAANKFFRASDPIDANRLRNALRIQLGENVVLGTPGSAAPPVSPAPVAPSPVPVPGPLAGQPLASQRVPVPNPRARAPAPLRAREPLSKPPTPVTSPPAVRRQTSVPVIWQQAVAKFLQSRDPKDLSVVPKGSLPMILALMGKSARSLR